MIVQNKVQKNIKKLKKLIDTQILRWYIIKCADKNSQTKNRWRVIEVVITRRSWKPFVRKGARVRIPHSPLTILREWTYCSNRIRANLEKYPSWPKGHPWKGCRSLIAARGFKSLLLRLQNANSAANEPWKLNSNATLKIPMNRKIQNLNYSENKFKKLNAQTKTVMPVENWQDKHHLTWEFDPGSGWTLAACLTHASRTSRGFGQSEWRTGE